jgi:hypothetical protein
MSNQYKSGAQTYVTYTFNGTALIVFELNFWKGKIIMFLLANTPF